MITLIVGNPSLILEKKQKKYKSLTKISSRVITGVESTKSTSCAATEEGPVCNPWALPDE